MKRPLGHTALRLATVATLQYEVVAILRDREQMPTFSRIAGTHRWMAPTLLVALAVHLWWPVSK